MKLPLRLGGLGLPLLESISFPAFVASLANAAPLFSRLNVPVLDSVLLSAVQLVVGAAPATAEHLPADRDSDLKEPGACNTRFVGHFAATTPAGALLNPVGLQKILFRAMQDRWHQQWRVLASTPFASRRVASLTRKLASAWLGVHPEDVETTINDES
jgi:hypothetical protein